MNEIDNLIISLENYMIDPVDDLYLGNVALEGVNMDIAKLIRADDVNKARGLIKDAKKLARRKEYDEAIALLKEAKPLISKMKSKVDSMPEPENTGSKIMSWFTPLFSTLPREEINNIIYTGNGGTIMTYTTYTDEMSKTTSSSVKRRIQERFNLLLVNIDKYIKFYGERKRKHQRKMESKKD